MLSFYLLYVYEEEDEPQFIRLYEKYDKTLLRIGYYILNNKEDAEDAVQEAWIAIAQNMHTLRDMSEEKIEIYIFKTVKSKSINIYHKNKKMPCDFDIDILLNIASDTDVVAEYENREKMKAVISCLNQMASRYRDVLTLYFL